MNFDDAMKVLAALEREGVAYVVVGSMAMAAQGIIRATRDLDLFVSPDPDNIERLRRALHSVFADPSIDEITAEDLAGEYPAVEYNPPGRDFSLDILARLGDAFRFEDIEAEDLMVGGVRIRVATPSMLFRMKRDTVRPQDRLDAQAIKRLFSLKED